MEMQLLSRTTSRATTSSIGLLPKPEPTPHVSNVNLRRFGLSATWWSLPAHLLLSVILVTLLFTSVDGHNFRTNETDETMPNAPGLSQSDVTTLLSIALAAVRAVATIWTATVGWRMCFVVLEREGASLAETQRLIDYSLPFLRSLPRGLGKRSVWLGLLLWLTLICVTPSQFFAPMLNGAIGWTATTVYSNTNTSSFEVPRGKNVGSWKQMTADVNTRYHMTLSALGLAAQASTSNFDGSGNTTFRRSESSGLPKAPVNSTFDDLLLPYFKIHSLSWAHSKADLGEDANMINNTISNATSAQLSFGNLGRGDEGTRLNPYLANSDVGALTIVNKHWTYNATFPTPTTEKQSKWVALQASRMTANQPCDGTSAKFGKLPKGIYATRTNKKTFPTCHVFAKMSYTAGVFKCKSCRMVAGSVAEQPLGSPIKVEPDPLVSTALDMMPEVLNYMEMAMVPTAIRTTDDLDAYVRGMVSVAYQASWNAIVDAMLNVNDTDKIHFQVPVPVLKASVTKWRVLTWFAVNILVTLSGLIVAIIQWRCEVDIGNSPAMTVLLTDSAAVLDRRMKEDDEDMHVQLVAPKDGDAVKLVPMGDTGVRQRMVAGDQTDV